MNVPPLISSGGATSAPACMISRTISLLIQMISD
jgi:hypothetical protein